MARLWICEGYTGCWICLNKPKYTLYVNNYTSITMNMIEYVCINLKKQSAEYARILNVSDAVGQCAQPEIFQGNGWGSFVEIGHFDINFIKYNRRRSPTGNHFGVFSPDTFKITFWMENLTQRRTLSEPFFQKLRQFFWLSERVGEACP